MLALLRPELNDLLVVQEGAALVADCQTNAPPVARDDAPPLTIQPRYCTLSGNSRAFTQPLVADEGGGARTLSPSALQLAVDDTKDQLPPFFLVGTLRCPIRPLSSRHST